MKSNVHKLTFVSINLSPLHQAACRRDDEDRVVGRLSKAEVYALGIRCYGKVVGMDVVDTARTINLYDSCLRYRVYQVAILLWCLQV